MRPRILTAWALAAVLASATSCVKEMIGEGPDSKDAITFVVSVPSDGGAARGAYRTRSGGNGHGPTEGYRNYNADADTAANGTLWGGYASAEDEAAAFDRAVAALAANYKANAAAGTVPATRAIPHGGVQDNRVDGITILLFDADTKAYAGYRHIKKESITSNYIEQEGVTVEGTLRMFQLKNDDLPHPIPANGYTALFLANAAGRLATILGVTESALTGNTAVPNAANRAKIATLALAKENLQYSIDNAAGTASTASMKYNTDPSSSTYRPFIMSSPAVEINPNIPVDYDTNPIPLARGVAKINVVTAENIDMKEVRLVDYSTDAALIAGDGYWTGDTPEEIEERLFASEIGGMRVLRPGWDWMIRGGAAAQGIVYTVPAAKENAYTDEIFTYERAGVYDGDSKLTLLIQASVDGATARWFKAYLTKNVGGVSVPVNIVRNHSYTITIRSFNGDGYTSAQLAYEGPVEAGTIHDLDMAWNVDERSGPEEGMNESVYNGEYQLTVDRSTIVIGPDGIDGDARELLRVYTDYELGWTGAQAYTYTGTNNAGWLTATLAEANADGGAGTGLRTNGENTAAASRVLFAAAENTGNIRRATVLLTARDLTKTISIIQLPSSANITENIPDNVNAFAGAFWKNDQRGERLIRVMRPTTAIGNGTKTSIDGEWNAYVLDGKEWIVLDTLRSPDYGAHGLWTSSYRGTGGANGTDGNGFDTDHIGGDDEEFLVKGTATIVRGIMPALDNNYVYFRIGLRSTLPAKALPRYGTVLVVYSVAGSAPKSNLIWIRQGEEADYLMPKDATHTRVVPWSPYNLTAPDMQENADFTYMTTASSGPDGGGTWTDYPSQAGAIFQYQSVYTAAEDRAGMVRAWHPYRSMKVPFTSWDASTASRRYDPAVDETCPPYYRKPSTERNIQDYPSEMIHSLLMDVKDIRYSSSGSKGNSKNSVHGYYADGFFDRRQIVTPLSAGSTNAHTLENAGQNSAVAVGTKDVAYTGKLFYNTATKASIFFPSAGLRLDRRLSYDGQYFPGRVGAYFGWVPDDDPNGTPDRNDAYYMLFYRWGWGSNDSYNWNTTTANAGFHHDEYWSRTAGMSIRCVKADLPGPRAYHITSITLARNLPGTLDRNTQVVLSIASYLPIQVAAEVRDHPDRYTYQWQYRNGSTTTSPWVDIEDEADGENADGPTCLVTIGNIAANLNTWRVVVYNNSTPLGTTNTISIPGR